MAAALSFKRSDSIADSMPEALRQSRYQMKRCFARYITNSYVFIGLWGIICLILHDFPKQCTCKNGMMDIKYKLLCLIIQVCNLGISQRERD